jgi:hypothetical protein
MEPAPPYAARKTARTPRSRSTQGGVDAAIDPKRLGPSKRRKFIGLRQVRRLQRGGWYNGSRGRRNSEQGLHLWGCDSEAAQARRCRPSPVYEVTSRREPCSSLRRAQLAGMRTWSQPSACCTGLVRVFAVRPLPAGASLGRSGREATRSELIECGLLRPCPHDSSRDRVQGCIPKGTPLPRYDTPCKGTYLGCGAAPCIHPRLAQRASRE